MTSCSFALGYARDDVIVLYRSQFEDGWLIGFSPVHFQTLNFHGLIGI